MVLDLSLSPFKDPARGKKVLELPALAVVEDSDTYRAAQYKVKTVYTKKVAQRKKSIVMMEDDI